MWWVLIGVVAAVVLGSEQSGAPAAPTPPEPAPAPGPPLLASGPMIVSDALASELANASARISGASGEGDPVVDLSLVLSSAQAQAVRAAAAPSGPRPSSLLNVVIR